LVGRENLSDLTAIQTYFTKINVIKDQHLEFLKICSPHVAQLEDKKTKKEFFETAYSLIFGDVDKSKEMDDKKTLIKQLEKAMKSVHDVGGQNIYDGTDESNLLKKINENL